MTQPCYKHKIAVSSGFFNIFFFVLNLFSLKVFNKDMTLVYKYIEL
jgi:hypothetical protein